MFSNLNLEIHAVSCDVFFQSVNCTFIKLDFIRRILFQTGADVFFVDKVKFYCRNCFQWSYR